MVGVSQLTISNLTQLGINCKSFEKKYSDLSEEIAKRVQEAIRASGHDPEELAELTGYSESTAYRWINGSTTNFGKIKLQKIANATRVRYDWLRKGEGERNPEDMLIGEYESRKVADEPSDSERVLYIESLRDKARSLSEELNRLAELERHRQKNRGGD